MHTLNTLYTAGYTGLKPSDLLVAALALDAKLVDVRISPYSRVPYWIGTAMRGAWGDRYQHIRELGNKNYKNPSEGILLVDPDEGTLKLASILKHQPAIILCACEDHHTCHRSTAAHEMEDRYAVTVVHLSKDDIRNYGKPAAQPSLF